jgi:hypothetical protein
LHYEAQVGIDAGGRDRFAFFQVMNAIQRKIE